MDPDARPSGISSDEIELRLLLARAVDKGQASDVRQATDHQLRLAQEDTRYIEIAAPIFALLGRLDLTFDSLERYFFNRGSFGSAVQIGAYSRRYTDMLFTVPMAAARADARFAHLTRDVGLQEYWRRTRTAPDYLRSASA
jgi:hypothetical protein